MLVLCRNQNNGDSAQSDRYAPNLASLGDTTILNINIALLQMTSCGTDQAANLTKGDAASRAAAAMGSDIALFPELWNIGYTAYPNCPDDYHELGAETPAQLQARSAWQAQAIERDGPWVGHFRDLAAKLDMAIGVTFLEAWPVAPRNTLVLIDRHGEIVLSYAKVHTCDFSLEAACTSGDEFPICSLDTRRGPVSTGAMICYDREFPESARLLMLHGAELILVPNACPMEANRLAQLQTRAFENMVAIALTNYAAPEQNGHSVAYDGIAFEANHSRDMRLIEADEAETIVIASLDLDRLRDYRARETWGNAFRRPHRYDALTATEIREPFVRANATGVPYDPTQR